MVQIFLEEGGFQKDIARASIFALGSSASRGMMGASLEVYLPELKSFRKPRASGSQGLQEAKGFRKLRASGS